MSAAAALIDELNRSGIRLEARGDKLHVTPPPGMDTSELRQRLAERKTEIMAALKAKDAALLARCRAACRGLPVSAAALLAALDEADKAAIRSGDPDELKALRTFAECLAEREKPKLDAAIAKAYRWCQAELARRPEIHRAACTVDADPVLLALAIRGRGFITLRIAKERYNEAQLLEIIDRVNPEEGL